MKFKQFHIHPVRNVVLPAQEVHYAKSGVPIVILRGSDQEVFKLEIISTAGAISEHKPGASHAMAGLLSEGTDSRSALQIAEQVDFYGATLQCYATPDVLVSNLYSMTRFVEPAFELFADVNSAPAFPDEEIALFVQQRLQQLEISQQQNDYLANRRFASLIFGDHPYGVQYSKEDYLNLTKNDLKQHFAQAQTAPRYAFLTGDVPDVLLGHVMEYLNGAPSATPETTYPKPDPTALQPRTHHLEGPQPHQAAIRIGRQIGGRKHPDFPALFMLEVILGGYFGSRLMKNIREEKGLTYHIQSSIEHAKMVSSLVISTEANAQNTELVLREIYAEIDKLRKDLVPVEELDMVRNYIMGNLLMTLDGPFAAMQVIKPMWVESLEPAVFNSFIESLHAITAQDIRKMAEKYLEPEALLEVVVGFREGSAPVH